MKRAKRKSKTKKTAKRKSQLKKTAKRKPQVKKTAKRKPQPKTIAKKKQTKSTTARKKKPKTAGPQRILAVAVGDPNNSHPITDPTNLGAVRPYITGMVAYLTGQNINLGTQYVIDYQECYEGGEDFTVTPTPNIILCMSTPLVKAASNFTTSIFVVGVSSKAATGGFGNNVCGVNAQRTNNPFAQYYTKFKNDLPNGTSITLLNRTGNLVSEACKNQILQHVAVSVAEVDFPEGNDPRQPIIDAINPVVNGGLLVLPVDVFFGWSGTINTAAANNNLSVFWPAAEFAKPGQHHFGASQVECGRTLGEQVQYIFTNNAVPTGNARWKKVNPS